ncbi:MAG: hypothetical protein U1F53_16795 [Burkholderiaceae bacterium]
MQTIQGVCRANIAFALTWPDAQAEIPAQACGCSFCQKHGGVWTSNPAQGELDVTLREPQRLALRLRHRHGGFPCTPAAAWCPWSGRIEGQLYAVVSVNAFEGVDPARLKKAPISFDGEDEAARLARRQRGWIPTVRVRELQREPDRRPHPVRQHHVRPERAAGPTYAAGQARRAASRPASRPSSVSPTTHGPTWARCGRTAEPGEHFYSDGWSGPVPDGWQLEAEDR